MEKKQRVPKGEKYWCIEISMGVIEIVSYNDVGYYCDNRAYETGNYYCNKEDAESAATKLRAVLAGADVIEMPSEEEIESISKEYNNGSLPNDFDYRNGFKDGIFYLESKIVK